MVLRLGRMADDRLLTVHVYRAGFDRAETEDRFDEFGPLGADEAADAEDLAAAQFETHVAEGSGFCGGEVFDSEDGLVARDVLPRREPMGEVAADHVLDDPLVVELLGGEGADHAAVAHDGDLVGNREDLFHLMGDVDDRRSLAAEATDDFEKVGDLVLGEGRGRLVHDDHLGVIGNRLGHLYGLDLGHGELADPDLRIDVDLEVLEERDRVGEHLLMVDQLEGTDPVEGEAAEPKVLHDAPIGNGQEFLVDHGYPGVQGLAGVLEGDALSVQKDLAAVGLVDAEQAFHQGRFAGAVLAHQGMHGSGFDL